MGGADQWGNITAGLELIRRVVGRDEGDPPAAFGMCSPLLLTRDGAKMGKSEKGAVFLDPTLTSPFDFFQYWLNDDDALVVQHLKWLTLMSSDEIANIADTQSSSPESRPAQRALAFDLTARVHGADEAQRQVRVAEAAFSGAPTVDPAVLGLLYGSLDHHDFADVDLGMNASAYAVSSNYFPSNSEARRQIAQGSFSINYLPIRSPEDPIPEPIDGQYLVLRTGKKRMRIDRRSS
jgi:tyrosyl-tRNA synthetase